MLFVLALTALSEVAAQLVERIADTACRKSLPQVTRDDPLNGSNDRLETSVRPQLAVAPDPAPRPDSADIPAQLSDLTKQVRDLKKIVKKLSKKK